jgi:hypothetical protein
MPGVNPPSAELPESEEARYPRPTGDEQLAEVGTAGADVGLACPKLRTEREQDQEMAVPRKEPL